MRYCKKCILPSTRPGITLNREGICSACTNHLLRNKINWKNRETLFDKVISSIRNKNKNYDCLIPVSGGKDSTWQVIKCLEKGLNPLCVTWKPPSRTKLGQENLSNLINLGVDHIDYTINPNTERKFIFESLIKYGSPGLPMHMAIFNIPTNLALKLKIPLIIWGENSAFEYGDDTDEKFGFRMNSYWYNKFGVTHGTTADDWISKNLTISELIPYFGPKFDDLEKFNINSIFLGYYFNWDVKMTSEISKKYGFKESGKNAKIGIFKHTDLDDDFISIHHFLKWYKFGFTRTFDNCSLEIRNRRMTREKAVDIVRKQKDIIPHNDIKKFCNYLNIKVKDFFEIIERFRNKNIWIRDNNTWKIKNYIVKNYDW